MKNKHRVALFCFLVILCLHLSGADETTLSHKHNNGSGHSNKSNHSGGGGDSGQADQCESDIFPCSNKILGNLVLIGFYGVVLGCAAKLISDGAEGLLDLDISPAIIGGVVLPVMGAVPDSVMIMVSGMGPKATVQNEIAVGMGTLAGSTILLLTIAWGVSLIVGRTDVEVYPDGTKGVKEKECSEGLKLMDHGVQVSRQVTYVAIGMLGTAIPYLIVQISDWKFGARKLSEIQPEYVKIAALVTMIICFAGFFGYLASQIFSSQSDEDAPVNVKLRARRQKMMAHAAFKFIRAGNHPGNIVEGRMPGVNYRDPEEVRVSKIAKNYGKLWRMKARAQAQSRGVELSTSTQLEDNNYNENQVLVVPENAGEEPKWKIALGALSRLIGGVLIVTIFSDPMCDALTALTDSDNPEYIPIGAFYVSFVVTPLCSNASELVSSILMAMQKEKDKINMTYSQIYGACIMNNTLCLGVFCALIYFRDLSWTFSAETTVILLFEAILGFIAVLYGLFKPFRAVYPLYLVFGVLIFYPVSIGIVAFLENVVGWG